MEVAATTLYATLNISGIGLANGDSLNVDVDAYSQAGSRDTEPQATAETEYVTIDLSPPNVGKAVDASPCSGPPAGENNDTACWNGREGDVEYVGATSSVAVWWRDFTDAESTIEYFSMCAGTAPQLCDLVGMTRNAVSGHRGQLDLGRNLTHAEV